MTKVNIKKSEDTYCSKITSKGHSGYSQEGSDIVCAAMSSTMELVIDMLDEFLVDFDIKCDEENALIEISFKQNDNNRGERKLLKINSRKSSDREGRVISENVRVFNGEKRYSRDEKRADGNACENKRFGFSSAEASGNSHNGKRNEERAGKRRK